MAKRGRPPQYTEEERAFAKRIRNKTYYKNNTEKLIEANTLLRYARKYAPPLNGIFTFDDELIMPEEVLELFGEIGEEVRIQTPNTNKINKNIKK